jgi:exonuclease III
MLFLSFNCRGLASPSKKLSLKRIVEIHKPDVLFFQELICEGGQIVGKLETLLGGWEFRFVDAQGRFGDLILGWHKRCLNCSHSWCVELGLGLKIYSQE